MDTEERLLREVAHDVFSGGPREPDQAWRQCAELGWGGIGLQETDGGSGGELRQLGIILRELGYAGGSSPLPEHAIGVQILGRVEESSDLLERALAGDLKVIALPLPIESNSDESLARACARVPWGRSAELFVGTYAGAGEPLALILRADEIEIKEGTNVAGEPRDEIVLKPGGDSRGATVKARGPLPDVSNLLAFFRCAQIAGALRRSLDLSVEYAKQRVQFGRPIGSFQAVGHNLARVAELCEAADAIVQQAYASNLDVDSVAAAKIVTSTCVREAVPLAHQIHGAIGVTKEYELQRISLRATAWSQEAGAAEDWAYALGERVCSEPDAWWDRVSAAVAGP
jgi:acyl-CoA dehydrogenase